MSKPDFNWNKMLEGVYARLFQKVSKGIYARFHLNDVLEHVYARLQLENMPL